MVRLDVEKQLLQKKLSKKLNIPWISADTIESIVGVNASSHDKIKMFPKSVVRKKTKQSNDLMYSQYSAKSIKNLYIKQAKTSWKAIEVMIECETRDEHDFIIEGHQIHPKLISSIIKKHGKKNIHPLVVTRFDVDKIVEGCLKHSAPYDWFIQKTKEDKTYYKIAEMIKEYSSFFDKEAKKYKINTVNVDAGFLDQIKHSANILQGRLK